MELNSASPEVKIPFFLAIDFKQILNTAKKIQLTYNYNYGYENLIGQFSLGAGLKLKAFK